MERLILPLRLTPPPAGPGRLIRGLVAAVCLLPGGADAQEVSEYAIMAAYLTKLAPFIEWPATAFTAPDAPIKLCVIGSDPFGSLLDRAASGARDGDHAVEVTRLDQPNPGCQIAYVGGPDKAQALEALKTKPVLTITNAADGGPQGIVSFVLVGDHVRFDIDQGEADQAGIRISSKLLALANSVKTEHAP